jgi:2-polyprenyl-3-methyl-5-hydroxy-6-metoxy-1,4-benzoquinol methylase
MKQHIVFLYILIALSLLLCLRYLGENYVTQESKTEGFQQNQDFLLKMNENIYDDFYVNVYDTLYKPKIQSNLEIKNIITMTHPSIEYSRFLDIGSGTGSLVHELNELGYSIYGIDKSVNMIDYSQNKYKKIHVDVADALETMLFERGTFTHIICNYFTIYQFKDKTLLLRNCYHWITPGGKLILHLVDKNRFDTIIPAGKPLNIESPQKYTNDRLLETHIEFDHYKYSRKTNKDINMIQETFTDYSTGNVRQNEQYIFMETKEEILYKCKNIGFVLYGQINYERINGDQYQYMIILEKPM